MPKGKRTIKEFDPEFRFLLPIDPAFEPWQLLATEWLPMQRSSQSKAVTLAVFFLHYLHALELDKRPVTLFEITSCLPDLRSTLALASYSEKMIIEQNDCISDFLDWVLHTHLAKTDADGHRRVPKHLHHPFPRIRPKKNRKQKDNSFEYVLTQEPRMVYWVDLAAEWLRSQKIAIDLRRTALDHFLVSYLIGCDLPHRPADFLTRTTPKPLFHEVLIKAKTLGIIGKLSDTDIRMNNHIADFLDWVLVHKLSHENELGHKVTPPMLYNPVVELSRSGLDTSRRRATIRKIDPQFRFLLTIDPAFEQWRMLAIEWIQTESNLPRKTRVLTAFFVRYLHSLQLNKQPRTLFDIQVSLPDLWSALDLGSLAAVPAQLTHDIISDFLEWVLRTHLAEPDAEGHRRAPKHLRNPFPRLRPKQSGKQSDCRFRHVVEQEPRMVHWVELAAEWLNRQKTAVGDRRNAIDHFLMSYLIGCDLPHHPVEFLTRTTPKPLFHEVLIKAKTKGAVGQLSHGDVRINKHVSDFLDWVLTNKLSYENEHGHRIIPPILHNPVAPLPQSGVTTLNETAKAALSIRYIKELRTMLAEGPDFCNWRWAQQALEGGNMGGDWYAVDQTLVQKYREDPDCVWRERKTSIYEQKNHNLPPHVTELWSPVRAVALYLKLELPLRTHQVRMLDSGEADTWRYEYNKQGGHFALNDSPLATGTVKRPYQRGVFHRSGYESGAGLFINTNKSADCNKPEHAKGYVIPWAHEPVLYWLAKLRRWQEIFNPISAPTAWTELQTKHFGCTPPHPDILEMRGTTCFLFRDAAAASSENQNKPIRYNAFDRLWYLLLSRLEQRCLSRGETLDDGTPIRFVDKNKSTFTYYPPHALRVSLISYLVLDQQLPLPVVSKLIAGHARLIMTLYYTKFGHAYMKEVLNSAEHNTLAVDQANHRRFLMDATLEQVNQRFACVSVDAMGAAVGHQSAATFVFEDKGICPVGGTLCDVGGKCINDSELAPAFAPVPGYPERNCVRCRFFLSGPAFLPGLQAHFNSISYEVHERAKRYNELQDVVTRLENSRADCERDGSLFTETRELEKLSQRYEAEAEAMGKVLNDLQATYHLIERSLEILNQGSKEGVQLIAVGEMNDIQAGLIETTSELHQLEVLCENAMIYPEIDPRKPSLRRAQLLDCMLAFNKMPLIFFHLSPQQQLEMGNAVMKLIQARTGSLKGALEFAECQRHLRDIGLVEETWDVLTEKVSGTPVWQLIDAARATLHDESDYAS